MKCPSQNGSVFHGLDTCGGPGLTHGSNGNTVQLNKAARQQQQTNSWTTTVEPVADETTELAVSTSIAAVGGTGVIELTEACLATLPPKVDLGAFSGQRQG